VREAWHEGARVTSERAGGAGGEARARRGAGRVALGFTYHRAADTREWVVGKIKGGWARESGLVKVCKIVCGGEGVVGI